VDEAERGTQNPVRADDVDDERLYEQREHDEIGRLEKPDPRRALTSALTIGGAYVADGFIPLAPPSICERPRGIGRVGDRHGGREVKDRRTR
jgi:hypothetical protein